MEIDGFDSIISTVSLAKELHDIDRFDIVQEHFSDTLCWDSYYENMHGAISSVFSGFYSVYNDNSDEERMIFTDDYISRYYEIAYEYGRSHNVCHDENPYVIEAESEVNCHLRYCYGMGCKLLAYTKTKKTARQSRIIVYTGSCACDCHNRLASGLVQLYKFFSDKCKEFDEGVIAA